MNWYSAGKIKDSSFLKTTKNYSLTINKEYIKLGLIKGKCLEQEINISEISVDGSRFIRIDKFGNSLYLNIRNKLNGAEIWKFMEDVNELNKVHESSAIPGKVSDNNFVVLKLNSQDFIGYGVYSLIDREFLFERRESVTKVHLSNEILFSVEIEGFNPTQYALVALDIYTGAVLWKVKLRDNHDEIIGVHKDKLLCNISGKGCAINLNTGQIIWQLGLGIRCVDHSQQLAIQYGSQGYNEFNLSTGQIHQSGEYKNKIDIYTFLGNPVAPILYNDFLISPSRTMKRKGEGCGIGFLNRKTLTWDYVIPLEYPVKPTNSFYMENDLLYALDMNDTLHIFERER